MQFLIACMCRTVYVWEFFCGTSVQTVLRALAVATVSRCCAYLCLSSALFCSNLSYARVCAQVHFHVCSVDILRCVPLDKRDSVEMGVYVCVRHREPTYACVRSPQPHRSSAPPLSRTSAESPNSQMATAHRQAHTVTRTDTNTHTPAGQDAESSAGAKVNR